MMMVGRFCFAIEDCLPLMSVFAARWLGLTSTGMMLSLQLHMLSLLKLLLSVFTVCHWLAAALFLNTLLALLLSLQIYCILLIYT